ncbi:MAG TPA: helix-turn-helix transcriptional regulator [Azospirillum sp.]|nr:helix-turn-helix transcriptional regulator [Azospirillum sp.]
MPSQAAESVAERLLRARERAGYGSAQEVADAFGWPDYPSDESGERTLTAVRAKLYAHAFHVEPEWLLSGEGEPAAEAEHADSTISDVPEPTDELAERIGRLTSAQRQALIEFLRTMQGG